jgi:hypothetical protein
MRMLVAAVLVVLAACGQAPPESYDAAGVRRDVTALVQRWSDAGEAGDWDEIADTYADVAGFAWIERGEVRYPDRATIVAGLQQARQSRLSVINDVSEIVVTPLSRDAAAYRANYRLAVTSSQFSFSSEGVLSGVAIRQGDRWRFLQGALNEGVPVEN